MIILTEEQVVSMHKALVEATGGSDGLRDRGLLNSALETPFQTFGGNELYPTLFQKASRLCCSLISNHPFIDGNKRIGVHAMLVFLYINGEKLTYTQNELIETGLGIASGQISADELLKWIENHR